MEWTRDKTLNLINEYRKRRGLWDMTHDDYRKKEMKQKLLVEVANCLGDSIPVVEIEKKFHTLRTQYHREINRMKRKEPYNSKWFGFKTLQFLSSPKACRMGKGRMKSEITEEGTVTKYIIQDLTSCNETSGGSVGCSSNNINEEFVAVPRKPNRTTTTSITYENANEPIVATSRSRELEKLIEETTKDVDEVEEAKPKMPPLKHITLPPLEHHSYSATVSSTGEMSVTEQLPSIHQQQHHQESNHHQQQQIEEGHVETIDIQTAGDEITYQTSNSPSGNVNGQHASVHHQTIPTRIIKIQRRDTCQEEDFYNEEDDQQQQEHSVHHSLHSLSSNTSGKHRIYYEANGQQHTATLLTTPNITPPSANSSLVNSGTIKLQRNTNASSQQLQLQQHQPCRDEFTTYGEYVANEMRCITSREIMIALKHKINTALFEANMAELQK